MLRPNAAPCLGALAYAACVALSITLPVGGRCQVAPTTKLPMAALLGSGGSSVVASVDASPAGYSPADLAPVDVADALAYHKRYQEAIATYAGIPRKSASIWNKMGVAYQLMDDLRDAAHCYKKSIRLDGNNAAAFNNLGAVYESQLQIGEAEKMFRKAVQIDPNFALGYKNLATSLMDEHKCAAGRAADERALTLDPTIFDSTNYPSVGDTAGIRDRGAMNYYMAIDCVRAGQTACALDHLRSAMNLGYASARKVMEDINFAVLAGDPAFRQLLAEQRVPK